MKRNRKNIVVNILIIVVMLVTGIFAYSKTHQTIKKVAADNTSSNSAASVSAQADIATPPVEPPRLTYTGKIPILMYHYIRDYTDQGDPIGVGLSVSPAKFAAQLDYLKSKGYQTITFRDVEKNIVPAKSIILTFDDGYIDFYQNAYPELKKRQMTAVSYIVTGFNGGRYMNNSQIKEIASYGIEIGSHTISHQNLATISLAKAKNEITDSQPILENITGKPVISFCYPAGKFNDAVVALVKNSGYKYATTTKNGLADFTDPLILSRYRIGPDTNIASLIK
ncbi:MAG: polysaccharide deacetylase family protein [bacterium]|nr:polysaccharide deacetylase family protein [bacterium]